MVRATAEPAKPDTGPIRYLGIVTAAGLVALSFATYVLPRRPGVIVGGLALILVVAAGSQFLFHVATKVSIALEGQRRTQFQILVSLAVPVAITLFLSSRVDAVPLVTLWTMPTLGLLIPLGVITWASWYAGGHLSQDHPFRGFIIAAAILGLLCFFWSAGMTSESDYDGEGSSLYLDPEKAKRARATGEYVWRFILYVTTAYLVLFLRWRSQQQNLTPKILATIEQQAAEINSFTSRLDAAYKELEATGARLKEVGFKDDVTGLYNRRFFSLRLEEEVSRYTRLNHPVCLVLLDLDGFNAAKEEYGRAASEDILRDCAQILMKQTRGINVVARFDADLFAVLLVETSNAGARLYVNRIREAVAVYPFSHGKLMKASFGATSLPGIEEATAEALFQAADEALFVAKHRTEPL